MCLLDTLGQSCQDITRSDHSYAKLVYLSQGVDICLFKPRPDKKQFTFAIFLPYSMRRKDIK